MSNKTLEPGGELEYLREERECINMWLDERKVPRGDDKNQEYSMIGRLEAMLRGERDESIPSNVERKCRAGHKYLTAEGDLGGCWCGERPALELVTE